MYEFLATRSVPLRGEFEKVLKHQMAVLGGDAFRMELQAVHRPRFVGEPHDEAVVGFRRDAEVARHGLPLDHQRMIARRLERPVDAAEHARALMAHLGELAVHRLRRADDLAAERLADRLMAEADPE